MFGPVAPHCLAVVCFSMTVGYVAVGADSVAWVGDSVAADYIAFAADSLPVCHDSIFADCVIEKTDYVGLTAYCGYDIVDDVVVFSVLVVYFALLVGCLLE